MSNTHGVPDTMYEIQGLSNDLLPACIVSTTFPAVPAPPSLTLAAFATAGYVKDGPTLVYVTQEAHTVVLTGGDGQYWLALSQDTWTTVASWNRTNGTHYLWRPNATRPPDVDGLLVFCQLSVSGGAITVVTPLTNVTSQPMSKQNSNAVAITGGSATLQALTMTGPFLINDRPGNGQHGIYSNLAQTGGTDRFFLTNATSAPSRFQGNIGLYIAPDPSITLDIGYARQARYGLVLRPLDNDTGPVNPVLFYNAASVAIGSISTTASATSYNTTSDGRLKERLEALSGGLATLKQLLPVRFRWKADGAPGVGFVAQDVAPVVPEAVTGTPEAPEPMGMDMGKLVPYLVSALQDLSQRLEALEARQVSVPAP